MERIAARRLARHARRLPGERARRLLRRGPRRAVRPLHLLPRRAGAAPAAGRPASLARRRRRRAGARGARGRPSRCARTPRQHARFLCGITSPATTRARLTREPLFGSSPSVASPTCWHGARPSLRAGSLSGGAAWARWPSRSSKPVRCGSPTLGRFDSGAAPLSQFRLATGPRRAVRVRAAWRGCRSRPLGAASQVADCGRNVAWIVANPCGVPRLLRSSHRQYRTCDRRRSRWRSHRQIPRPF